MRHRVLAFLVLAAIAAWLVVPRVHAQQPTPAPAFLSTAERLRAFVDASANGGYIPGETLVKFREGTAPADQTRALSALRRGTTGASSRWIGSSVLLVSTPDDGDAAAIAATLARQPEVEWAQPNYVRKKKLRPNDPGYVLQWNMDLINLPGAWDINRGAAPTVTVALIDSGVNTATTTPTFRLWTGDHFENVAIPFATNPDIATGRIRAGRDFVFWAGPVLDLDGHGTQVAGTILQETNNSFGTAGIAYQASLLPLKVCFGYWDVQLLMGMANVPGFANADDTGCPDDAIGQAIRFAADSGAQIINISLSGGAPAPFLRDALNYAVSRGSFVAMAVGNEFFDGNPTEYPAAYAAQINGAVAVGAVNRSSKRAPYSNTGSYVELVAPGGDFTDGALDGLVTQIGLDFRLFDQTSVVRPRFDRYDLISVEGTSAASPHVAGVAALLYAQGITSPAAIESALERTATDLGTAGRDPEYGFGLINARAAVRGMGLAR
jgi:serine protease